MTVTRFVGLVFKGAAMGAANVIPGVSGGTIALITGIYAALIDTLKSVGWKSVKLFAAGEFRKWFDHLNGPFACAVILGVATSVFTVDGALSAPATWPGDSSPLNSGNAITSENIERALPGFM